MLTICSTVRIAGCATALAWDLPMASLQQELPLYLDTPPNVGVPPPTETRLHQLPLGELSWEDFERLCLRIVREDADVEHCQLYGVPGQSQQGIDLYARPRGKSKYTVYQCKRVNSFGPSKIASAVTKYLDDGGEWLEKSDAFVLCTKESLRKKNRANELERQAVRLREKEIALLPMDKEKIQDRLKDLPKIVDDFFGRSWVVAFCGDEAATTVPFSSRSVS